MKFIGFKSSMKKGRERYSCLKYLHCGIRCLIVSTSFFLFSFPIWNVWSLYQLKDHCLQLLQFIDGSSKQHNDLNSNMQPEVGYFHYKVVYLILVRKDKVNSE